MNEKITTTMAQDAIRQYVEADESAPMPQIDPGEYLRAAARLEAYRDAALQREAQQRQQKNSMRFAMLNIQNRKPRRKVKR